MVDYWQDRWVNVIERVSFSVRPGEVFGLVGESGCGKTTTALTLLGYHRPGARISGGKVYFRGRDILQMSERELRHLRGSRIGFVPQDPVTALSPAMRVGSQILETLDTHRACRNRRQAHDRMLDLLSQVQLPQSLADNYPHQLSGGQQQRIMIAMALCCGPDLLVLDEPTTGLDVTTQAQVLELLVGLQADQGMTMVYVTHNLGVLAWIADKIGVMYAGQLVEEAPAKGIFRSPSHPYTRGLIAAVPKITAPSQEVTVRLRGRLERDKLPLGCPFAPRCDFGDEKCRFEPQTLQAVGVDHKVACWRWMEVQALVDIKTRPPVRAKRQADVARAGASDKSLLAVSDLDCAYTFEGGLIPWRRRPQTVVRNVCFTIAPNETFGLVGESGSGKSTIARAVGGLLLPTAGEIAYDGQSTTVLAQRRSKELRRDIQLVFQNPNASLNPRHRVLEIIGRPLEFFFGMSGKELRHEVEGLLERVELDPSYASRYPDQLSGGERQRVAIARGLAARPRLLLCDEILSGLDVSVQWNILELMRRLQAEREMAYLFISHDLAVVRSLAQRVGVLYRGELWEVGLVEEVFQPPFHPYTHMLLSAVPEADPEWRPKLPVSTTAVLADERLKTACSFAPRCLWKMSPLCEKATPPWQSVTATHFIRCHRLLEELVTPQEGERCVR